MRLTPSESQTIAGLARESFGPQTRVFLFGSRTDDAARGGDIDLYIETTLDTPAALRAVFDSSTGFLLANGAVRSPDAAWVARARWEALTPEKRAQFAPLCPDFVAELVSPGDDLSMLRAKLVEYLGNGARLGWLLDPGDGRVEVYRPGVEPEVLDRPAHLTGEAVLPGLVVDLAEIL